MMVDQSTKPERLKVVSRIDQVQARSHLVVSAFATGASQGLLQVSPAQLASSRARLTGLRKLVQLL